MAEVSKAVLITGCSTGIGRATAQRLADAGHTVFATARRLESIADLEGSGCKLLALDVNDEESMIAAVRAVEDAEGAVGVLVNNAGYSQSGAIETVPMDQVQKQFDTNVFGLIRMTQLVLPGMRSQRWGRVVNISSMGGKMTFPGGGLYHATKYAVEAISDALRFEVAGFGIKVVVVEPGLIRTEFADTAVGGMGEAAGETDESDPYAKFNRAVAKATAETYTGPLGKLGAGPEAVAETIQKAIEADRPRTRYPVTPSAWLAMVQRRMLPDRAWDVVMGTQFPRPGA
jgi:NADP-dependent 3-hydroxy acid dehydrogenase YdfG